MEIVSNNIKFKTGDKINLINIGNNEIFKAEIGESKIYSNYNSWVFDTNPFYCSLEEEKIEKKNKYEADYNDLKDSFVILHESDIQGYSIDKEEHLKNFIWAKFRDLYKYICFRSKLLEKYDSITRSKEQGYVTLHSSERNKKLEIKLGRLIRKLSVEYNEIITKNEKNLSGLEIKDSLIEELHNSWMAHHESNIEFEILKGNDILKGYTRDNYISGNGGSLSSSCMTDKHNYLKIYTENPEQISLIVFKFKGYDKIIGRALLWKADDGKLYHDRIYYAEDWYEKSFMNKCEELGYEPIYNLSNTKHVTIKLDKTEFDSYPYVDTFYFISLEKNMLKNYNAKSAGEDRSFCNTIRTQHGAINGI